MTKLDEAIASTAYILNSLTALRNIYETGCCNNCEIVKTCHCKPKIGQMVRYNCPFYVRKYEEQTWQRQ